MANYTKTNVGKENRVELHDLLALTGAEVSINLLPAGTSVPFVHAHKQNEEIYGILEGAGSAEIDGQTIALQEGDWIRIAPCAKRRFFAADHTALRYLCIQVKENSLTEYTATDAVIGETT